MRGDTTHTCKVMTTRTCEVKVTHIRKVGGGQVQTLDLLLRTAAPFSILGNVRDLTTRLSIYSEKRCILQKLLYRSEIELTLSLGPNPYSNPKT